MVVLPVDDRDADGLAAELLSDGEAAEALQKAQKGDPKYGATVQGASK